MKQHIRKPLADQYECLECSTVFRKEAVEITCQHKCLSKYTIQPEVIECPFCGCGTDEFHEEVQHSPPVTRHKEIAGLLRRKYQLEEKIEQCGHQKITQESVYVSDKDDDGQPYDISSDIQADTQKRDGAATGKRRIANEKQLGYLAALADVERRIDAVNEDMPEIKQFPCTVKQNCLSGGVTVNPQIDWGLVDMGFALYDFPIYFA